tara:strand:- start:101 stop:1861 length:1761 start_codon:yes stop_codon:yes gene_type:complete
MKNIISLIAVFSFLIVNGQNWNQLGLDIDGETAGDQSGYSVSINASGDRVAIGANYNGGNGPKAGHVRVYEWSGNAWVQLGLDIDGEAMNDQSGCSVSMNASGDRVAIGAQVNDGNFGINYNSGHVRIYEWSGTAWVQLGLDIDGETSANGFGCSVSMNANGDRVAIGARTNSGNGIYAGHVRIYEWSGTAWVQLGIDIDGEAANDYSGWSVFMNANGDRVAIGAPLNNGNGSIAGHVRIYEWSGTAWVQLGLDIDGEAGGDYSGRSLSMNANGDRVAIGAHGNVGNGTKAGHVRVYEWSGTVWVQLGLDIDGEANNDYSGWSVSMNDSGDRVAIGAVHNDGNGNGAGHVRVYEWSGTAWVQLDVDIDGEAAGDDYGQSVSINAAGDRVAIGAPENDGNGSNSGHVMIYEFGTVCNNYLEADTISISIPDSNFQNINSFVRLERTDSFVTNNNCDSIIERYYLYNYSPIYCTDTLNVFDTTYVSISVTDTLYIDILITGINNLNNTIKVYPNPANDIVVIDNGNYSAMSNYSINITNSLSQQVYSSLINTTQLQISVSTIGSVGTYFIQILDGNNSVVETKQLVLH